MIDHLAAQELLLYITNDGTLYRSRTQPIIANMARKLMRGQYDAEKSVKAWCYLADDGAKKYNKEFTSDAGFGIFNPATRQQVAVMLRDYYEEQVRESI